MTAWKRPWVMVLTYNEGENITELLERILAQPVPDLRVLVVDDGSPDGTAAIAQRVGEAHDGRVRVLRRPAKEGYGAAYEAGLRHLLDEADADAILSLDADLSHNPDDIPRLLEALQDETTVVVGSRYAAGGGIADWPPHRRLTSWVANALARQGANLAEVKDVTSGFRAFPASLARRLSWERAHTTGYGFLQTLLQEFKRLGARFAEVPIVFTDRTRGTSKLGGREMVAFAGNLGRLALRSLSMEGGWRRVAKFAGVGLVGLLVNTAILYVLTDMAGWYYLASAIFAIEAGVLVNFALHERITFHDRAAQTGGWTRLAKYHGAVAMGLLVNVVVLFALVRFAGIQYLLSNAIGIGVGFVLNFGLSSRFAWAAGGPGAGP